MLCVLNQMFIVIDLEGHSHLYLVFPYLKHSDSWLIFFFLISFNCNWMTPPCFMAVLFFRLTFSFRLCHCSGIWLSYLYKSQSIPQVWSQGWLTRILQIQWFASRHHKQKQRNVNTEVSPMAAVVTVKACAVKWNGLQQNDFIYSAHEVNTLQLPGFSCFMFKIRSCSDLLSSVSRFPFIRNEDLLVCQSLLDQPTFQGTFFSGEKSHPTGRLAVSSCEKLSVLTGMHERVAYHQGSHMISLYFVTTESI